MSKSRLPGLHFIADNMDLASVNLTLQLAPRAAVLCEMTRNDSHWAVNGHPRSPIENPHVTSNE